jgi:hypothetical protein
MREWRNLIDHRGIEWVVIGSFIFQLLNIQTSGRGRIRFMQIARYG